MEAVVPEIIYAFINSLQLYKLYLTAYYWAKCRRFFLFLAKNF